MALARCPCAFLHLVCGWVDSMAFLRFPLVSFVFLCVPLVLLGFQGRKKGKDNPRKRQTNGGKSKESLSAA